MATCIWGYRNVVLHGALSAGAEEANQPVENLREPVGHHAAAWQTPQGVLAAADGAWVSVDAGSDAQAWRAFALTCTNLTPLARVRWRVGPSTAVVEEPSLVDLDFAEGFSPPGTGTFSFTRASPSWRRRADGVWEVVAAGVPAIHHDEAGTCLGLLLLRQLTNSIRNARAEGGAGGSPGTPPTNWNWFFPGGLSLTSSDAVTEDGLPARDFRFFGTASGAGNCFVYFENLTAVSAAPGDILGMAVHARLVGGTTGNISSTVIGINEFDSSQTLVNGTNFAVVPMLDEQGLGTQRKTAKLTVANAATVSVRPYIRLAVAGAGAVDFTIRVAMPTLNTGATIPSVPIAAPPLAPAASTRQADVLTYSPGGSLMSPAGDCTFYIQMAMLPGGLTGVPTALQVDAGSGDNSMCVRPRDFDNAGDLRTDWLVRSAGSIIADTTDFLWNAGYGVLVGNVGRMRVANGFACWAEAFPAKTDPDIGGGYTRVILTGTDMQPVLCIRRVKVYAAALTDGQCTALAATGSTLDPAAASYDSGWIDGLVDPSAGKAIVVTPAAVVGRYARCDIEDLSNPAGFLSIGLAYAGAAWQPADGVSWASAMVPEAEQELGATRGGQEHVSLRWRRLAWDLLMEWVSEADHREHLQALVGIAAAGQNILFIPDPADAVGMRRESIFGLLTPSAGAGFPGRTTSGRTWQARISDRL